jgi:hypothetical protein
MTSRLAEAIKNTAADLGIDAVDLATVMSYETGGTFDEWKAGPTTQWGQHFGLIQWGQPQREKYGVYKGMPVEAQVAAAGKYLRDAGVRPGMGLLDIYSAINAGSVGRYDASDANNGGAPGTVRDKVQNQMEGHRAKAAALLGGDYQPPMRNPYEDDQDGPAVNYDIHSETSAVTVPTTPERVAFQNAQPQGYDGIWETIKASASSDWYTSWALRKFSEDAIDPDYTGPTAEEWKGITERLPENYHDYLLSAGSRTAYEARLKLAEEDIVRQQRLAASGWTGFGIRLLTGIGDPVALPLNALTGGVAGSAAKGAGLAGRVAIGALTAGASNAAMEAGAQTFLDDPNTDPLMAFGVGALLGGMGGALARNTATAVEAQTLAKTGVDAIRKARGFVPDAPSGGAASNTSLMDSLVPGEWGLANEDVPTAVGGGLRFDAAGQMTTSEEPLTRLIGQNFFEETVGFKGHEVVPDSVTVRAGALERRLLGNLNAVFQTAMSDYVKAQGNFRLNLAARARSADEFRSRVWTYVQDDHPSPDTPSQVVQAAQAVRDFFRSYNEEINKSGLAELRPDPNYMPLYTNHARIAELDNLVTPEAMQRFIKSAILEHTPTLDDALADRMAKGYWATIRRAGYGIGDPINQALGLGDKEAFKKAFAEGLDDLNVVKDEDLDTVFDLLSGLVDATKKDPEGKGISRLKRRTLLDYGFSASVPVRTGGRMDLSMRDFFVQDAEFVARRYGRNMSGRIAFANTKIRNPQTGELLMDGIKTEADLERLKDQVRNAWARMPGGYSRNKTKLHTALANIDFAWARINGTPVYGQETAAAQWVRRIKVAQFIRLMSNMGLNQIQEVWKITAMTGFRAAIKQLPAIRRAVNEAGRSVARKDELLAELEAMTGTGLDDLWGHYDFRFDDDRIGAMASSRFANAVDTVLDYGQKLTADVSLMRGIHIFQQRWAVKAIAQQLYGIAKKTREADGSFNLDKLRGKDKERLASIGLGPEEVQSVFGNMLEHSTVKGKRLVSLGSQKWDPAVLTKFTYTLDRYTNRLVQQNDIGGLHRWMSNPVVSLFTQFRGFVLGAWAKSTLYNLHHMDPKMLVFLLGELAAGVATYVVRAGTVQAFTEEGQDKFWEETMDPVNLAKNGVARTATSSILPMVIDSALMFTPVGPQFGSARASGSPTDALFGSPAAGHIKEIATASKGFLDSAVNDREMTKGELTAAWRAAVPLGNFLPLAGLFSWMIQDKPDRAPR